MPLKLFTVCFLFALTVKPPLRSENQASSLADLLQGMLMILEDLTSGNTHVSPSTVMLQNT